MKFRKMLSCAMAAVMLSASCAMPVSASDDAALPVPGDTDCSGTVNIADAVMLARFCAEDAECGITAQGKRNADVNGDGDITAEDTAMLLNTLAGLSEMPAAEFRAKNLLDGVAAAEMPAAENTGKAFAAAQDLFAARLLRACAEAKPGENIMISPVSVALALSMTANGADGLTLSEMTDVLSCYQLVPPPSDGDAEEACPPEAQLYYYNECCYNWLHTQSDALKTANSVWYRQDGSEIDVPEAFLRTVKTYYDAEIYSSPLDDAAVQEINAWCSKKTDGMIPKIVDELNPNAVMLLLNALCFEADWSKPYGADFVREGKFTNADGSASTVEMMYGEENTYYDDGKATGFGKSYAGGQYSFVGVLPNEGVSMEDYLSALMLDDGLRKLLDSAKDTEVMAELPKFSFSYDETLNDMLMSLGMPTAFDSGSADFSRLSRASGCYISRVLHKTFIDLCENGTRAGAVTAVELTRKGLPVEMKRVCLDRPFVFMILDESNGGIPIFIGIVNSL